MRVYKNISKYSKEELNEAVSELEREGWHPGPPRIEIDALYPHQCHLYKDLKNRNKSNKKNA